MTTTARYDEVADFYEQFAPDSYDESPLAELLELAGDVAGLRLLDLACGHGRVTRELARRGAEVVGADISAELIDKARAYQAANPLPLSYVHVDVTSPDVLSGEVFDGATCHFALADIDDLDGVAATVARTVRPGGFFAFALLHPCFSGWPSKAASSAWSPERGYYHEGWWQPVAPTHGLRTRVGANHRMLSTYITTLAAHGLMVETMLEPGPPADWLTEPPAGGAVPVYLAARCRR